MAALFYSKKSSDNQSERGFSLAELLIAVAIIAVLTAIAIPAFSKQLEKSRDAVTVANLRSEYAYAAERVMTEDQKIINGIEISAKGAYGDLSGLDANLPFSLTSTAQRILGAANGNTCYVVFDFSNAPNVRVDAGTAAYVGQIATEAVAENRTSFNFYDYYTTGEIWEISDEPTNGAVTSKPDINKIYFLANANDYVNLQGYYRFDGTNWYHADDNQDKWTVYTPKVGGNQIGG